MRTAGLLILLVLFPVFVHAAALVNINTANATLLDTLPGIGPSKAAAIVTYRTQHGLFARIEDIQNVSGIGPSTFADIAPLITVGDTSIASAQNPIASSTPSTATSTPEVVTTSSSPANGGPAEYLPIPILRILDSGDRTISSGADVAFTAVVYDGKGNKRDEALVAWSFGDGMRKIGASVYHKYYDPGEYVAIVHATTPDGGDVSDEMIIMVKDASIKIVSVSSRGITLANNDSRTLDISLWRLSAGGKEFKIPEDTEILAGHTILFPSQIIELPVADVAFLLYPSGEVAATYGTAVVQPLASVASYEQVQAVEPPAVNKVESVISTKNIQTHDEAVGAPAPVSNKETGAGAASTTAENETAAVGNSRITGIFKSPWTLSFLGVIALAGGAFIFL